MSAVRIGIETRFIHISHTVVAQYIEYALG